MMTDQAKAECLAIFWVVFFGVCVVATVMYLEGWRP